MGHTPGPWRIDKIRTMNGAPIITAPTSWMGNTREICKVLYHGGSEDPEVMGNAALLEAAPDLLAALELANELLDNSDVRHYIGHDLGEMSQLHKALNTARAAIAKAKGAL